MDQEIRFHYPDPVHITHDNNNILLLGKPIPDNPDWGEAKQGSLWSYNLNYFDYIFSSHVSLDKAKNYIENFNIVAFDHIALDPYPISVRGINWIKFFIENDFFPENKIKLLRLHYEILFRSIEYQHNANHLLENGLSLWFAGNFFNEKKFLSLAKKILSKEVSRQILDDGAHFELSPMYQRILFGHILDAYAIGIAADEKEFNETLLQLKFAIQKISCWLENIQLERNIFPEFGDSVNSYGPLFSDLIDYSRDLNIEYDKSSLPLKDSGFRVIRKEKYTSSLKFSPVSPDSNPGHSHSDLFSFELRINNSPVLVDTGVSTYDANEYRSFERSVMAHNTVNVDNFDQNEMWGAFRIGKRASLLSLQEEKNRFFKASHDGFRNLAIIHEREFIFNDDQVQIIDRLLNNQSYKGYFFLHFAPGIIINQDNAGVVGDNFTMKFEEQGFQPIIKINDYQKAMNFNERKNAKMITVQFRKELRTQITIR